MTKEATTTTHDSGTKAAGRRQRPPDDVVMTRLVAHLDFLRLTHTKRQLEEVLAWARRERPAPTDLLEHVLGEEVASKRDARIERRITTSGLFERKLLETFDFDFSRRWTGALSSSSPDSTSSNAPRTS